jgi:hypothetical protein
LRIKRFPLLIEINLKKLRYAYGICSKVQGSDGKHFLLFDCDGDIDTYWFLKRYEEPIVFYRSRSGKGWHVIVFREVSFPEAIREILDCPYSDRAFVSFACRRGYLFLETTIPLFWTGLTYMRIERNA